MKNQKSIRLFVGFFLLIFSTAGHSTEPTLQAVQVTTSSKKIEKVIFLYEEKNLSTNSPGYSTRQMHSNRAYLSDTGFPGFGDVLVINAERSLAASGVSLIHSGYAPEGRIKDYQKNLVELLGAQLDNSAYVVLSPSSATSLGHSFGLSTVNVVLSVQVTEVATGSSIWSGQVNTSTQIGKGIVGSRLFERKIYDETYAAAIFSLLAKAWLSNGVVKSAD